MTEHPLPSPGEDETTLTGPQAPTPQRVAAVRALRTLLAEGYATPEAPVAVTGAGWPDYDERVLPGLAAAQELAGVDVDYLCHVDRVSDAGIDAASLADLGTLFTYVLRGERFSEGHIGAALANGKVGRMLDRLAELVPQVR